MFREFVFGFVGWVVSAAALYFSFVIFFSI